MSRTSDAAAGDSPPRHLAARRAPAVLTLLALIAVLVAAVLPAPYVVEQPGPVFNTIGAPVGSAVPVIRIDGHRTYPTTGRLDALTVSVVGAPGGEPPWLSLARDWFDPTRAVVPVEEVYPVSVSGAQVKQQGDAEMQQSQQAATAAALSALRLPVSGTVRIGQVEPGSAASGLLRVGDVVHAVNGIPLLDPCSLQDAVATNGAGTAMRFTVVRAGREKTVSVAPRTVTAGGQLRPLIGIGTTGAYTFPFTVRLRLTDIGGPSAGQMFALGIIDKLTPGSLTGGRHVAGTGTICADGAVGAIGGIVQKMAAARAAGATVFLAPRANCAELVGHIPAGLTVYAVRTLGESLADLKAVAAGSAQRRNTVCTGG
ncbi:PDZ domain-containing protein [uncultured Amnibacterium sp.]|uniref:YlbL family protein n=1 Tax=uncultured Amnibacterium sp. TaxID=1631851 RepID=UPI0035CC1D96